jgi:hypothetical protein
MASVGLGALGDYKLGGVIPLRSIFNTSFRIGDGMRRLRGTKGAGNGNDNGSGNGAPAR